MMIRVLLSMQLHLTFDKVLNVKGGGASASPVSARSAPESEG